MTNIKDPADMTDTEKLYVMLRSAYLDMDQAMIGLETAVEDRRLASQELPLSDYLTEDEIRTLRDVASTLEEDVNRVSDLCDDLEDRYGLDGSEL